MSNKVPQIRFNGYSDDWEERKLKDVLDISKTKNKTQQYGKVDVLSVSREVGTVNQIKYQGRSFAGSDLSNYKVVQGGELIYTKSPLKGAPYGIFQVATIKGILSPLYAVYTSTDKAYTPFVAMALKNDNIATHYLTPLVTKGAKNTINVTDEGALEGKIQFPSILEQKQIFIFFKQLDDTIALHQRKLDLLKEQKKGYLQKMFPKNGAKVPELRFAGFADAWEERKFGELYKKVNEKNDLSFGKDRVISVANMYFKDTGDIRSDDAYMKTYNIFRTGDIAFEGNRSKHFSYGRFVENTIGDGIVSHVFDVFRPIQQFDLNYWKYAIHNERVMGPILMTATTSSTMMTNLVAKDFLKRAILVPSYSEQKLVGSFFKQLDDTIALHQRELDLLKEQKKGYLQKMFC